MRREIEFYDESLLLDRWGSAQCFSTLTTWRRAGLLRHEMVMEAYAVRYNAEDVCRH